MHERNLAAIDMGTNSFHIIIVKVKENGSFESLGKEKESVRLGSGSGPAEIITPDAMERGMVCLDRFKKLADMDKAEIRAVATSAVREARNKEDFLKRVEDELGIHVEIISGYEEARLIYFGILQGLQVFDRRVMMVDIGGGSIEILIGEKGKVLFAHSLKMGAIRLTDKFFNGDPDEPSDISQCKMYVQSMLSPLKKAIESLKPDIIIGSSGTIQSIAQMVIANKKDEPPRSLNNYSFTNSELKKIRNLLNEANTLKKRTRIPGLEAKRADIIVAGSIILEEIFNKFSIKEMIVSEYALREGIIFDSIQKWKGDEVIHDLSNIRLQAVNNLFDAFPYEKEHVYHTTKLCTIMFDELQSLHKCNYSAREYLQAAAMLHEVGFGISHTSHHKHSYYIIKNSELMVGFNYEEIEIIALIARYHRKSMPKPKHQEFNKLNFQQQVLVRKLAGILRIADGLDRGRQGSVQDLKCKFEKDNLIFQLDVKPDYDVSIETWSANQKKDLFANVFNLKVEFEIMDSK